MRSWTHTPIVLSLGPALLLGGCGGDGPSTPRDTQPPTISSMVPAPNVVNVPPSRVLMVVCSEPIAPTSATTTSFTLTRQGGTSIAGQVTVDGTFTTAGS